MPSFRAAHAWLRGYSDALAGKLPNSDTWPENVHAYVRGFQAGIRA